MYRTKSSVKSSPAVDPITGWIYIGSHDHHVYSLDIEVHYRLHMYWCFFVCALFIFFHLLLKRDHLNCLTKSYLVLERSIFERNLVMHGFVTLTFDIYCKINGDIHIPIILRLQGLTVIWKPFQTGKQVMQILHVVSNFKKKKGNVGRVELYLN